MIKVLVAMTENNMAQKPEINDNFDNLPMPRTNFLVSFCFLVVQVLIPGAVLFFLTSRDFSFTFHIPLWLMVLLGLLLLVFALLSTSLTYKLQWHQADQFTYIIPFASFIIGLYLTSYWMDYHYFLIRFIIAFACAIFGIFLASVTLVLVRKKRKK